MKALLAAGVMVSAVMMTGCASTSGQDSSFPGGHGVTHVEVSPGRVVPCIWWKLNNAGGLSCDWSPR